MDGVDARKQFSDLTKSFRPPSGLSDKSFVGLKFNRSMSGRWGLKREAEAGEHGGKRQRGDWDEDSSEDEDFSLADVGADNAAVQSMLGNDEEEGDSDDNDDGDVDELRFDNQSRMSSLDIDHHLRYHSPIIPTSDNDSVNNAINSILDFDRGAVQTPEDLKHLTGLLDSSESDTQNAVNSIL